MNLRVENGILQCVTYVNKGRLYSIKANNKPALIIIRFYKEEDEIFAKKFEEETKNFGNIINIISDENTIFALQNDKGTLMYVNGFTNLQESIAYDNKNYLMEVYGKTEEDFFDYLNEQLSNKKLELKK